MKSITFETSRPFDHAARALDFLRTMGFDLVTMSISRVEGETYAVDLAYEPRGSLSEHTLLHRLAGLTSLSLQTAPAAAMKRCG
jgi:hypothetical protein